MKKNMGGADRIIRLLLAAVLVALYGFDAITGTLATIALVVAAIFVLTSFVSFCPLYYPFGISSCKTKSKATK